MTFNLNILTRQCFENVGLISEEYSGGYNDSDYLIRLRKLGGTAIIADAGRILHVGRGTIGLNADKTQYCYSLDREKFVSIYPEFSIIRIGSWHDVCNDLLAKSRIFRLGIKIGERIKPHRIRTSLLNIFYRLEPFLHRA